MTPTPDAALDKNQNEIPLPTQPTPPNNVSLKESQPPAKPKRSTRIKPAGLDTAKKSTPMAPASRNPTPPTDMAEPHPKPPTNEPPAEREPPTNEPPAEREPPKKRPTRAIRPKSTETTPSYNAPDENRATPPTNLTESNPPQTAHDNQPLQEPAAAERARYQNFQPRHDRQPEPRRNRSSDQRYNDQRQTDQRYNDQRRDSRRGNHNRRHRRDGDRTERSQNDYPNDNGSKNQDDRREPRRDREPRTPRPETPPYEANGYFECSPRGYGFLRQKERAFFQTNSDVFVPPDMARDHGLREGLRLEGVAQNGSRGPQLIELQKINDSDPAEWTQLPEFSELTAINPNKRVILETDSDRLTTRVIDLMAPIGRGQRGLIVAPPRTGKTTLLKHIAQAVRDKNPDTHLMVVLIDERPEEVTDFKRSLPEAELFASSNDSDPQSHTRIAHFAIERAKRLSESGRDVFMVLDSITRLARASNNNMGNKGGKTMSGGIDSKALEFPRKLFAAARCTREAGSLTIIATALIETGSRMDDLIYQEFKGTGNMELVLSRKIAESYIYPAVDIFRSGTRREELLLPAFQLEKIHFLRRGLAGNKPSEAIERLLTLMKRFETNNQMMVEIKTASL